MDKGPCPEGGKGAVAWASFEELGERQRKGAALLSPSTPVPQTCACCGSEAEQPCLPSGLRAHGVTAHMRHASIPQTSFPEVIKKTPTPTLALWVRRVMVMPWNKLVRAGGRSQGPSTETGAEVEQGTVRYHQTPVSNVNSSSKEAGGHLFWERLTP